MFKGKNFEFETGTKTYIMGILNVTADSFFDGGKYNTKEKALRHTLEMIENGADIVDIGAQSTRPGHKSISAEEELKIIKEYLPYISDKSSAVISVDTFYPIVAEYALQNGASIVNDVSGVFSEEMAQVVKKYGAGWIITHTGGGSADTVPEYQEGVISDIKGFFADVKKKCIDFDISNEQILPDVGIGFGKTTEQNLEILRNLDTFKNYSDLMVALSNKRVVGETTEADGYGRVYGTISANVLSVAKGANFVRVHNVKENVLALKMADAILRG